MLQGCKRVKSVQRRSGGEDEERVNAKLRTQAMSERDRARWKRRGGGGEEERGGVSVGEEEGRFRLPTSRHSCIVAIVFVHIVEL